MTTDDTPNFLSSPHLFRHKYDIDAIIAALCAAKPSAIHTGAGQFPIEPLPLSFIGQTPTHPSFAKLPDATRAAVTDIIANATTITAIPPHFGQSPAGDWLRERVKDMALEWLDGNDLIPPSMRHVPRQTKALTASDKPRKISIT